MFRKKIVIAMHNYETDKKETGEVKFCEVIFKKKE